MTDERILDRVCESESIYPTSNERFAILAAMSAARQDERERVEGEFAEWCDENSYRRNMKGYWYKATGGSEDYALHTTPELYQLFLKSKTPPHDTA